MISYGIMHHSLRLALYGSAMHFPLAAFDCQLFPRLQDDDGQRVLLLHLCVGTPPRACKPCFIVSARLALQFHLSSAEHVHAPRALLGLKAVSGQKTPCIFLLFASEAGHIQHTKKAAGSEASKADAASWPCRTCKALLQRTAARHRSV